MAAHVVRYAMLFINIYVVSADRVSVTHSAVTFANGWFERTVSPTQDTATQTKLIVDWAVSNLCVMNVFIAPLTILP